MMKSTAKSPANIAFVKHWGLKSGFPATPSLSMNKSACFTVTTAQWQAQNTLSFTLIDAESRNIIIKPTQAPPKGVTRMVKGFLAAINALSPAFSGFSARGAKIISENHLPTAGGMASSASGFSALALSLFFALPEAIQAALKPQLPSLCALGGSFSAVRSLKGPFTHMEADLTLKTVTPPLDFALFDITAQVSTQKKKISSQEGHLYAQSSPLWTARVQQTQKDAEIAEKALKKRDLDTLLPIIKQQSLIMHAVMMTSAPNLYYATPETWQVIGLVEDLAQNGEKVTWTLDAGSAVHIIGEKSTEKTVLKALEGLSVVKNVFVSGQAPAGGEISGDLF